MILNYKIIDNKYINIKQVAKEYFKMSERLIAKLKHKQLIFKNNSLCFINEPVNIGDTISFDLNYNEESENIIPTKMDLDILFEDDSMLIVNKKPFIAIHPSINHFTDSLSNGIKFYFNSQNINKKIRPVNRLDIDTSGIVIFAKNEYIQEILIKQMNSKEFKKTYLAIVENNLKEKNGTINLPIDRSPGSIIKREINENGQNAITHYSFIKEININNQIYNLVEFILETGRTHQIRVHSSYIGNPLLGDTLYGNKSYLINRQALHCHKLKFIHPITKKEIEIISELPSDIKKIIH